MNKLLIVPRYVIILFLLVGVGIGFYTFFLVSEPSILEFDNHSFECPLPITCETCPDNSSEELIGKEGDPICEELTQNPPIIYGDFDIQVLKEQAERIVKKHNCFKQQYIIIGLSKWEDRLYGMEKNLRLVYDNEQKLHGWITFNLIYIKDRVDAQTIKLNVDVSTENVTCEMINLTYVQKERR